MTEVVRSARRGLALEITIDRPTRRNAINEEVCAGIALAIDAAEADLEVRAIVITGAGDQAFSNPTRRAHRLALIRRNPRTLS